MNLMTGRSLFIRALVGSRHNPHYGREFPHQGLHFGVWGFGGQKGAGSSGSGSRA